MRQPAPPIPRSGSIRYRPPVHRAPSKTEKKRFSRIFKFNNESKLFLVQVFFPSSTNLRQRQLSIEYDLAFFLFTRFYSIETWIFIIIISRHGARTSLQRRIRWRGWPIIELPSVIGTKDADLFFVCDYIRGCALYLRWTCALLSFYA